jgi:hypothetical protein
VEQKGVERIGVQMRPIFGSGNGTSAGEVAMERSESILTRDLRNAIVARAAFANS